MQELHITIGINAEYVKMVVSFWQPAIVNEILFTACVIEMGLVDSKSEYDGMLEEAKKRFAGEEEVNLPALPCQHVVWCMSNTHIARESDSVSD